MSPPPLGQQLFVRLGVYAWALIGLALALVVIAIVFAELHLVTIPLVLALFPATVLVPVVDRLERVGVKRGVGAGIALVLTLLVGAAVVALAVSAIQTQAPVLVESVREGYDQLTDALQEGMFGLDGIDIDEVLVEAQRWVVDEFAGDILGALLATVEGLVGLAFGIVALFFYLRDGDRIAAWLRDLLPHGQREHASEIGRRGWSTLGGYIRGQSLVALVDAVAIGIGLVILGVPLAFVLSVLIFFGGYVPIVGAFVTGALAVLVALASEGLIVALLTFGVVIAVQQLESNVLAPMVLGRSVSLHPLAILIALTVGAVIYGILGAVLAVPVAATLARAGAYMRERQVAAEGTAESA